MRMLPFQSDLSRKYDFLGMNRPEIFDTKVIGRLWKRLLVHPPNTNGFVYEGK